MYSKTEFCKVGGSSLGKKMTNKPDNNLEASPDEAQPKKIAQYKGAINFINSFSLECI